MIYKNPGDPQVYDTIDDAISAADPDESILPMNQMDETTGHVVGVIEVRRYSPPDPEELCALTTGEIASILKKTKKLIRLRTGELVAQGLAKKIKGRWRFDARAISYLKNRQRTNGKNEELRDTEKSAIETAVNKRVNQIYREIASDMEWVKDINHSPDPTVWKLSKRPFERRLRMALKHQIGLTALLEYAISTGQDISQLGVETTGTEFIIHGKWAFKREV